MINWKIKSFEQLNSIELYRILQLRINIFMLEQNCLYPECDDKDFKAKHLFGMDEYGIVAYARLLPPEISYKDASIGRVIVSPNYRGQKLGYKLMEHAIENMYSDFPSVDIRISAQSHLQNFYEKLDFVKVSDEYLEDDIPHIEMLLKNKKSG